ncbi:hypothetical protein [Brevundimonas sp.]|uniref:hypothetical protein n=1 Tax=Brevundimonas sp. TaxID=1871086 RepID=UPI002FCC19C6
MFDFQGPAFAVQKQREFMEDFATKLAVDQKIALRTLNAEISPVPLLLGGMEVLYVLATEKPPTTEAARAGVLQTLGVVATAIGNGQYGGPESRDRAWAMAAWAAHQVDPVGPEPEAPAVSPQYTTIAPEVPPPPAPPAA